MKRLITAIFLGLIFVSACKNDKVEKQVMQLTGTWQIKEIGKTMNDTVTWEVPAQKTITLRFSATGEVIDSKAFKADCGPTSLIINGTAFEIKRTAPESNNGFYVLCSDCNVWTIDLEKDELIVSRCSSDRLKFTRQ